MATVADLLAAAEAAFLKASFPDPAHEARYLLGAHLSCSPAMLVLRRNEPVSPDLENAVRGHIARRVAREPSDYLIGWKEFLGRRFTVDSRVLIPRPETEQLVAEVVSEARAVAGRPPRILDVGTGSGSIAVSVALECGNAEVTGADVSAGALVVAGENARSLGAHSVRLLRSDLFGALGPDRRGYFDIIVSNPPYVPTGVLPSLDPEVAFEPSLALDGGSDGLFVIRRIVAEAPFFLGIGGRLMLEIGFDQGPAVAKLLSQSGFGEVQVLQDLEGHDRIVRGVSLGPV